MRPPKTADDDLSGELGEVLEQSLGKEQDQKNQLHSTIENHYQIAFVPVTILLWQDQS